MSIHFSESFTVRWGDLDSNAHMKNTAYLDVCPDVRMRYFASQGFPVAEFERLRLGPVVRKDVVEYFRELRLLDPYTVDLRLAGLSEDGSHFILRNECFRADGTLAARITSEGGWLHLDRRGLSAPPASMLQVLRDLERTSDFLVLESSVRT